VRHLEIEEVLYWTLLLCESREEEGLVAGGRLLEFEPFEALCDVDLMHFRGFFGTILKLDA
jgi:hypothetical protein